MDFSVPSNLPDPIKDQLIELIQDFHEENLTKKGYETKRQKVLDAFLSEVSSPASMTPLAPKYQISTTPITSNNTGNSNTPSLSLLKQHSLSHARSKSTLNFISSKVSSLDLLSNTSSTNLDSSTSMSFDSTYKPMIPLLPRSVENNSIESLPSILRSRFETTPNATAISYIDHKGKDTTISWHKLYLKAEKVAHELSKNSIYKMDKVLLWYNQADMIEFTIAFLGCIIAGMVAVPVSLETYSLNEIGDILKSTSSKFILISNDCYKYLDNQHSPSDDKIKLLKNELFINLTFIKTNDLGTYNKAKKKVPTFDTANVSYIEFTRTPLGKLSGVVMRHKILMKQFGHLAKILDSRSTPAWKKGPIKKAYVKSHNPADLAKRYTFMNSLDPTRSTGLIFGALFNIFTGNYLIMVNQHNLERAGGYEELIHKFKPDILLNDQLQLKQVVINYLDDPQYTNTKGLKMNLKSIKCCLTSCTTIDTDVSDMVVFKWLSNLGCLDASNCYSPFLTLPDFGGIFISVRDQLGNLNNFPIQTPQLRLNDELFLDKEKLRVNIVKPNVNANLNNASTYNDSLKLNTFGFPLPDATLCVADLENSTLVPDFTVGEIWISSDSVTNEFYNMETVNDYVFNARLNYSQMREMCQSTVDPAQALDRVTTIASLVNPSRTFVRTKLIGFVHNGKIYVLSMIEDMILQNKLIRYSTWAHTSNLNKRKKSTTSSNQLSETVSAESFESDAQKSFKSLNQHRVVQTYYLQQICETLVRTVNAITDMSAFELKHNKDEHFLVMVVESPLAKGLTSDRLVSMTDTRKANMEKNMTTLTEQIYRILWIFHKIQPMCMLVVPSGSLPRRYASLELANSIIERQFLSGDLPASFVKFQFDHVILDFIPHSLYYNESIFSEHLSELRRNYLKGLHDTSISSEKNNGLQISQIDYKESSTDSRTNKSLNKFKSILEILDWRLSVTSNETAFSDGMNDSLNSKESNNYNPKVSWKSFEIIVASFLKKVVDSKVPLKRGDHVVAMCENSVEYLAIIITCWYCNLVVIPLEPFNENTAESDVSFFSDIIKTYDIKRIFFDNKTSRLVENHPKISKIYKNAKAQVPKTTNISKIKKRKDLTLNLMKRHLAGKFTSKHPIGTSSSNRLCLIWVNRSHNSTELVHARMTHATLLNECKILDETLNLSHDVSLFSLAPYTYGIGFIFSILLGIFTGCTTTYFGLDDVLNSPNDFFMGLQNMNVKDIVVEADTFCKLLSRANDLLIDQQSQNSSPAKKNNKNPNIFLSSDFLRNVKNIMIPFSGRPDTQIVKSALQTYKTLNIKASNISYVFEHLFNSNISFRGHLNFPPVEINLDRYALREGLIKEADPQLLEPHAYLKIQDSGIVPVCTAIAIVNPETEQECYDGEFGEIWCCSEANAPDYYVAKPDGKAGKRLVKNSFITNQFKTKIQGEGDNGLTYLRTGYLGFIKNISLADSTGVIKNLNLLYVLGPINETIDHLGLTHFITDLEKSVRNVSSKIVNCIMAKSGGLLVCLIKIKPSQKVSFATLTTLIVSTLLKEHGVILDLCCIIKPEASGVNLPSSWSKNRNVVMREWLDGNLPMAIQFGINYGENMSIYLLSEFNK